jgi:hypothetical protein
MKYKNMDWWAEAHGLRTKEEIDAHIRALYRQLRSSAKVGERLQISGKTVRVHLHAMGDPVRERGGPNNPVGSRACRRIRWQGELLTVRQAARRAGLPYQTLHNRLYAYGWPVHRAMTAPPQRAGQPPEPNDPGETP